MSKLYQSIGLFVNTMYKHNIFFKYKPEFIFSSLYLSIPQMTNLLRR